MKKNESPSIRQLGFFLIFAALCMLAGGCYQIVHVEDMQGNSVAGAQVTTQMSQDYRGGPGPSGITNSFGDAMLKKTAYTNPPLYINVVKQGYRSVGVDYSPDDKVTIRLQQIDFVPE